MKKSNLIIFGFLLLVLSGCGDKEVTENNELVDNNNNNEIIDKNDDISTNESNKEESNSTDVYKVVCKRDVEQDGVDADLKVIAYHDGINLLKLEQTDVVSGDKDVADAYEQAYKDINATYNGIKYYDTDVKRVGNTVTRTSIVDYSLVDTSKIIEIEGMEDNIFEENGDVKYNTWLTFFKKYGGTCE